MSYSPVTIEEAKQIAIAHGLQQLVLWSFADGHGQHVTTWGEPMRHSLLAAEAGNHVKRAAGWPEEEARALPVSLEKVADKDRIDLVRACAEKIDNGLAPLVAAGLVQSSLAAIIAADLRVAILESCVAGTAVHVQLPRTLEAREIVSQQAKQIGGA